MPYEMNEGVMKALKVLSFFAALAFVVAFSCPGDAFAGRNAAKGPQIKVVGQASLWVVPDEVAISLTVKTWGNEPELAKERNDEKAAAILAKLKSLGVEDKHLQTDRMRLIPYYDRGYSRTARPDGYEAQKSITINLQEVEKVDQLVMTTLKAGINSVDRIQIKSTKVQQHRDAARIKALANAKEKAIAMAGALDAEIGEPLLISEIDEGGVAPQGRMMEAMAMSSAPGGAPRGDTFAPGQIEIRAKVMVAFELK